MTLAPTEPEEEGVLSVEDWAEIRRFALGVNTVAELADHHLVHAAQQVTDDPREGRSGDV